jgi:hypothetical protein
MQETISEADILDFLDKLKLFVPNLGEYEYHSSENFQYLIKTGNHSIKVSMEQLIANRQKQLTQEHFKAIADGLVKKEDSSANVRPAPQPARKPDRQEIFEKKVDAGYKIYRNLLYLLIIFGLIAGAIYFIYENNRSRVHFGDGGNDREFFEDPEVANPQAYLSVNGNWRFNIIRQLKLDGRIFNNASNTTYKDITLLVQGKGKTGTVVEERSYVIREFIAPNSSIPFDFRTSDRWDRDIVSISIGVKQALVE